MLTMCLVFPPTFDTYFSKPTHHYETRFRTENNLAVLRIDTAVDKSRLRYILVLRSGLVLKLTLEIPHP